MGKVDSTKTARETAEASVKAHMAEIQKAKDAFAEAKQKAEEARLKGAALADSREDAAAVDDQKRADELRREVALAMNTVNEEYARARGLERRIATLEGETADLCLAALRAWLPELAEAEREALARLDDLERGDIGVEEVEAYVSAARLRYGHAHDLLNLNDKSVGTPAWPARSELEKRSLLLLAPSLMPGKAKNVPPQGWAWLLAPARQRVAA